jgi:hypothetical protein
MINTITGSDWDSGVKQLDWKVEYTYDGSNRLTKISEGVWNGTIITRYYDVSLFSNHDAKGFPQEEKNYQSDIDDLTNSPNDRSEIVTVTCGAASGLTGTFGRYFLLYSNTTEYYVWYNRLDLGQGNPNIVVPGLSGKTGIQVDITNGTITATGVATETATRINSVAATDFSADNPIPNVVRVTTTGVGDVTDASDGDVPYNTGFNPSVATQGLSAATTNYVYTYGSRETPETITMNNQTRQEYIYDASGNIEKINFYKNVPGWVLTGTQSFTIPEGLSLTFDDISPLKNPVGSDIVDNVLVF